MPVSRRGLGPVGDAVGLDGVEPPGGPRSRTPSPDMRPASPPGRGLSSAGSAGVGTLMTASSAPPFPSDSPVKGHTVVAYGSGRMRHNERVMGGARETAAAVARAAQSGGGKGLMTPQQARTRVERVYSFSPTLL